MRFERFLRDHRSELNSAFAAARRHHVGIDAERFGSTLIDVVAPVFDALADEGDTGPDSRNARLGHALYRAALDLEAHGLFGPIMQRAWDELLPKLEALLVTGHEPLVGAIANAVVKLDRSTSGRAEQWLTIMARLSPIAPDASTWMRAGQVAAWRSGTAAYRHQALDLAEDLDDGLLRAIFSAHTDADSGAEAVGPGDAGGYGDTEGRGDATIDRLRSDPWFDPSLDAKASGVSPAAPLRVGGFRGFGGPFRRPPTVRLVDDVVIATDGNDSWQLLADAFGSDLIRVAVPPVPTTHQKPPKGLDLGPVDEPTSWTPSPLGLVATSGLSHSIFLLGAGP